MRCTRALPVVVAVVVVVVLVVLGAVAGTPRPAAAQSGGGQVRFAESTLQAMEDGGQVRVVVERVDLPVSRIVVRYRTADVAGSAVAGPDYVQTTGSLVFDVGTQSNVFTVWVRDDTVAEETEHLLLHLETSSGAGATSRLTILDDDVVASSSAASAAGPSTMGSSTATSAPTPVVVASPARASRPVEAAPARVHVRVRTVTRPAPPRRIILQQTPTTPFELRPVPGPGDGVGIGTTTVDPLIAIGAGLLLARVAAEAWFRARLALA